MSAEFHIDERRIRALNPKRYEQGPVVYWMSRDQRVDDNWALQIAQAMSLAYHQPLIVLFCLVPEFLKATLRQYQFMLDGLKEIESHLEDLHIPFVLRTGDPGQTLPQFLQETGAGALLTDFDPLRIKQHWRIRLIDQITIPFMEIDAHNIIPCWRLYPKQAFNAAILRRKIHQCLPEYMDAVPRLQSQPMTLDFDRTDWPHIQQSLRVDSSVKPISWLVPGEQSARHTLNQFLKQKLPDYHRFRNDPVADAQSDLSPYLHFGQISPQRVAKEIMTAAIHADREHDILLSKDAFLEEMIVRRELSDNFCFYNPQYDSMDGFPEWAKRTLQDHRNDTREYIYNMADLDGARTHDPLWNAAQKEMILRGKMHGYMRMYWAKKILEWSPSPEEALRTTIHLNDTYQLDGRDPNGYAGIAWSIGGLHDRPWMDRPIFGKIRYMNDKGCKSKFNVLKYIEQVERLCRTSGSGIHTA